MRNTPPQNLFEAIFAPFLDLILLARASVAARIDLARHEAGLRAKALIFAIILGFGAIILLILTLILAINTLLLGLGELGLTPFQAHLATLIIIIICLLIFALLIRRAIGRAFRPFLPPAGEDMAPPPAKTESVDLSVTIVKTTPATTEPQRPSQD